MAQSEPYPTLSVASWSEFVEAATTKYTGWAFRGQSDVAWPLQSTLARRFATAKIDPRAFTEQESRILRIFQRKAHLFIDKVPDEEDSFRWLAMMQHHGAPTRLLDFTWSPYVAAFFALENATEQAAVWAINVRELFGQRVSLGRGRGRSFPPGMREKGNYEKFFLPNRFFFLAPGEPNVMNQRLIAQSGTFIVPSTLGEPVEDIVKRYKNWQNVLVKFKLPTVKLRERAMYELYNMNITQYTLFPGLDGLARSMAYEAEFHWGYDPRTVTPRSGFRIGRRDDGRLDIFVKE